MQPYSLTWLPDVLRAAGLTIIEEPGWQTRGHDDVGPIKGVICHHTAGCLGHGDDPSLAVVRDGRAGDAKTGTTPLAGPLAQLLLARSGIYHVIAAGLCYHAGAGSFAGIKAGNYYFVGIEAENTGVANDPWPESQMDAYARGCAAILRHVNAPLSMCIGHKEFAPTRKFDPDFSMPAFRKRVGTFMTPTAPVVQPTPAPPIAAAPVAPTAPTTV